MTNKIIITKPTYDARTEGTIDNIIFSSDYGTLKYYTSGTITQNITISGSTHIENSNINHDLNYRPFIEAYVLGWDAKYHPIPVFFTGATTSTRYGVYVNTTKLFVRTQMVGFTTGNTYTVKFYYFIFKNNLGV